jgi:hypothetical protein
MKVRCRVVNELYGHTRPCPNPDCENHISESVWICIDSAPCATLDSVFHYGLSDFEEAHYCGIAKGNFVELSIQEIGRGLDGIIRMKGKVSKFACDYSTRPFRCKRNLRLRAECKSS